MMRKVVLHYQVYTAWAYYYEHKEEIDRSIEEGNALAEKVAIPLDELKKKYKKAP